MCGIFGAVLAQRSVSADLKSQLLEELFRLSETRGKEATGLCVHSGHSLDVIKQAGPVSEMLASGAYARLRERLLHDDARAFIGHSRLVTNGSQTSADNNQPVVAAGTVGIHNGIIVNDTSLWARHPELTREAEVDTEVLVKLLRSRLDATGDVRRATRESFAEIEGAASVALLFDNLDVLLLATNTGSLYLLHDPARRFVAFASERYILDRLRDELKLPAAEIEALNAGSGALLRFGNELRPERFALAQGSGAEQGGPALPVTQGLPVHNLSLARPALRRCTRCILPETHPKIRFDQDGVCNYCHRHQKIEVKGEEALLKALEPYRKNDGSPDCIVAFSGGRDSCYGLHLLKTKYGMNPLAFTYDWGMVTDLARRNQARLVSKLGVEHIIRAADIPAKRRYIRKNVQAWLHRPSLGMVSLFMAGDKQFYHYARQLRKETGVKLVIFCAGNMIEHAEYKAGFCGFDSGGWGGHTLTGLAALQKLQLAAYFAKEYLLNPRYINESIWDTAWAYFCTFLQKDDFLYLYHYLPWREDVINRTLIDTYNWETSPDTSTTWRIGDGTAAFYNFIYGSMAGFTEDEVLLANMVREGHLTREQALQRAERESRPRWPSIREYAQLVGLSFEELVARINAAPKLYDADKSFDLTLR